MIAVSVESGTLRIQAELPVPNAPQGQWDPGRMAGLMKLIEDYAAAADLVDAGVKEIEGKR